MSFAVVFAGQGSQSLGMLSDLAAQYPVVEHTFAEASKVLGYDLWALSRNDADAINQTTVTQPLMLTAGAATWRVWCEQTQARPSVVAGHSLGEYTALVAADVLDFKQAVSLVKQRAELMQNAVPVGEGAMAAVLGLDDDAVCTVCESISDRGHIVEAVNFNAPGQVVIAGHQIAVEQASLALKERGARRAQLLPVSVPSHSSLMQGAAERLNEVLSSLAFGLPSIRIVQNVTGECLSVLERAQKTPSEQALRMALKQQLHSPVLWVDSVNTLLKMGVSSIVEMGGGKVLTGLNKRIVKVNAGDNPVECFHAESPESLLFALEHIGAA